MQIGTSGMGLESNMLAVMLAYAEIMQPLGWHGVKYKMPLNPKVLNGFRFSFERGMMQQVMNHVYVKTAK